MAEPLTRRDTAGEGVVADAALRLDRALQALERVLAATPRSSPASPPSPTSSAQVVELQAARRRGRELEAAAAEASQALGRAVVEVQRALEADEADAGDPQTSLFDDAMRHSALESEPGLPDDDRMGVAGTAPEEEPTE